MRDPGEDFVDYMGMLRRADEEFYDSQSILRQPGEASTTEPGISARDDTAASKEFFPVQYEPGDYAYCQCYDNNGPE